MSTRTQLYFILHYLTLICIGVSKTLDGMTAMFVPATIWFLLAIFSFYSDNK